MGVAMRRVWRSLAMIAIVGSVSGCGVLGLSSNAGDVPEPEERDTAVAEAVAERDLCFNNPAPETPAFLIVWLQKNSQSTTVEWVASKLDALAEIDSYRYIGQEETYQEFAQYFADEPEVVELVRPEDLPTSFEVTLASIRDARVVAGELASLAEVDDVEIRPAEGVCNTEQRRLEEVCEAGPFALPPAGLTVWHQERMADDGATNQRDPSITKILESSPIVTGYSSESFEGLGVRYDVSVSVPVRDSQFGGLVDALEELEIVDEARALPTDDQNLCSKDSLPSPELGGG